MISQQMLKIAISHADSLGTDSSREVSRLLKTSRWLDLVKLRTDPSSYLTAHSYFLDASATEFFRKMPGLPTGIDLERAALDTFRECEQQCYKTNQRVKRWQDWLDNGFIGSSSDLALYDAIVYIRSEVGKLLGPIPKSLTPILGPGSTFHNRGSSATIPHKFATRPALTPAAMWAEKFIYPTAWGRSLLCDSPLTSAPLLAKGNRFGSVPKDSTKNRGICIEPSGNLCMQLALGAHIKNSLYRDGIDLIRGQETHQQLASSASVNGDLATIDLSNASDTISKGLVKLLLPRMWFDLLDSLRSPKTLVQGKWVNLEKFSSMGNGFTFELETVLYVSIARAGAFFSQQDTGKCLAYGDDIIVPSQSVKTVMALLSCFGFQTNARKTFSEGPFRESCGGDFFNGIAVRPYYCKRDPDSAFDWMTLANGYRRVFHDGTSWYRPSMGRVWQMILDQIPVDIRRIRGPSSLGDVVIHDYASKWNIRSINSSQRLIATYEPVFRKQRLGRFSPGVQLASLLYGVPSNGAGIRNGVSGFRKRWRPYIGRLVD